MTSQDTITNLKNMIHDLERTIEELESGLRCRDLDELTGLHTLRWLREFWSSVGRHGETIGAIGFIDLDRLKFINDSFGHRVGDRAIAHVAASIIASGCYGVRYGGDEFLILVPAGWDVADTVSQIIYGLSRPIPTREGSIPINISCGVRLTDGSTDLHEMIHDADEAMYEVKRLRSPDSGYRIVGG